jgi:D-3-phosphoglycerate dehydrogenase
VLGPYFSLAQTLGNVCTQLAEGQIRSVEIVYSGEIADLDTAPLKAAVVRGLLQPVSEENVTIVNAALIARNRGLHIVERKSSAPEGYANLVSVHLRTDRGESSASGAVLGGAPHVVKLDEYWVNVIPTGGHVLLTRHIDRPGVIGHVGTILGETDINISSMQVGRERPRGPALMLVSVDDVIPPEVLQRIKRVANLEYAKVVTI